MNYEDPNETKRLSEQFYKFIHTDANLPDDCPERS